MSKRFAFFSFVLSANSAFAFNVANVHGPAAPIASGALHACAWVLGAVSCWGSPRDGRIGCTKGYGPKQVLAGALTVATGDSHNCALLADGRVRCWGANEHGQLGTGDTRARCKPFEVVLSERAISVSAGFSHSCAVLLSGRVQCWGNAVGGRLGNGVLEGFSARPVFASVTGARAAVSGDAHTCAILADSTVTCWGENHFSQLGALATLAGVAELSSGATHTCARLETGAVRCWGFNGRGQLGDGTFVSRATPSVVGGASASTIGGGAAHSCSVSPSGSLACWGSNLSLQLGVGPGPSLALPVTSQPGLGSVRAVVGGDFHTCALLADQSVHCWGGNSFGQLGTGAPGPDEGFGSFLRNGVSE